MSTDRSEDSVSILSEFELFVNGLINGLIMCALITYQLISVSDSMNAVNGCSLCAGF